MTVACDGNYYSLHKFVLSVCSEYFEEMLQRTDCKHPVIVLNDVKCDVLESLLNYMYLGEVSVLQEDLASLIRTAEYLKIRGLALPDQVPPKKSSSTSDRTLRDAGTKQKRSSLDLRPDEAAPQYKRRKLPTFNSAEADNPSEGNKSTTLNLSGIDSTGVEHEEKMSNGDDGKKSPKSVTGSTTPNQETQDYFIKRSENLNDASMLNEVLFATLNAFLI